MTQAPKVTARPKTYPAPEFPPRKPKLFARTPPAIFPALLGLQGLALALRRGMEVLGIEQGPIEALIGALLVVVAFALLALAVKIARRPAVVLQDLAVLPGRAGYATASMGVMASAALVAPYAPVLAWNILLAGLALHGVLAVTMVVVLARGPAETRGVTPVWHLNFVGFIVGGVAALALGQIDLAQGLLLATMPVAALIWGLSLAQLIARIPPAPLRPLLAIHLAPAALFVVVAQGVGQPLLALTFAGVGSVILTSLLIFARWITASGFSPLWGAFTFPISAAASAALTLGETWQWAGMILLAASLGVVPLIAWQVLKLWPGNRLAQKTNAAEA